MRRFGNAFDGFLSRYNFTDFHELNLDWLILKVIELNEKLENFVSLNTIKYADPIQWNIASQYERNTVVIDPATGTAYLSVQPVPSGVAITNPDYWTVIFDLDIAQANNNITLRDDGNNVLSTFTSVIGDWLLWNGTLYKVIADIGLSQAYVPGYNVERYTVEEFINDYITGLSNDITSIINMIGNLDDLTTTDKTNLVNAINELHATIIKIRSFLTFEEFGAVGDGITDDTTAIKNALIAAKAQHKPLTCCGGTYLISDDLTIDSVDLYEINKIVGSGQTFYIRNRSTIKNVSLESIKVVSDNYHILVDGLGINNHGSGIGFEIEAGAGGAFDNNFKHGTLISNVIINNNSNTSMPSTGFVIPFDCVLFNCEVVDCMTGYKITRHSKLISCTCWVSSVIINSGILTWSNTVGYRIESNGVLLDDCTADTMATSISTSVTGLSYTLKGFKFINNNTLATNKEFYLIDNSGAAIGDVTLLLTGFAAAGNHITLGHKDKLYVSIVDASGALRDRPDGWGATVTNSATVNRATYYNNGTNIFVSFKCTWGGTRPSLANPIEVTPQSPCIDLGMIKDTYFNAYIVATDSVTYETRLVACDAHFDGTKFVIVPYFFGPNDEGRIMHFDAMLPITKNTI